MLIPNYKYIITDEDIADILIAYNNQDYEWIIYFFESLEPADGPGPFTLDQILEQTGIVLYGDYK